MTLRQSLTDIADFERQEAEAAAKHAPNPELLKQNFAIIAEYARRRIEKIVVAERKHEGNGTAQQHSTPAV